MSEYPLIYMYTYIIVHVGCVVCGKLISNWVGLGWVGLGLQSILQLIALMVLSNASYVNIASILISMISVSSKAIVFSYAPKRSLFVFNWLCFVTDFWGIFCVVTWLFVDLQHAAYVQTSYVYVYMLRITSQMS